MGNFGQRFEHPETQKANTNKIIK